MLQASVLGKEFPGRIQRTGLVKCSLTNECEARGCSVEREARDCHGAREARLLREHEARGRYETHTALEYNTETERELATASGSLLDPFISHVALTQGNATGPVRGSTVRFERTAVDDFIRARSQHFLEAPSRP